MPKIAELNRDLEVLISNAARAHSSGVETAALWIGKMFPMQESDCRRCCCRVRWPSRTQSWLLCHVQHTYLRAALTSEFQLNPSPSQHPTPGGKCCLREQEAWQGNGLPLPWVCDWQCFFPLDLLILLFSKFKSTLEEFLWVKVLKSLGRRLQFKEVQMSLRAPLGQQEAMEKWRRHISFPVDENLPPFFPICWSSATILFLLSKEFSDS